MDLGLKDKVAMVAASSQGLGKAVALGLAQEGAKLTICARGQEKLNQTAAEIRDRTGAEVLAVGIDVTVEADVQRLVEETLAQYGRVDILVCNAGGPPSGVFDDFSPEQWRQAIELNLMSTVNLCRAVVPLMREQRWGRIINITSVSAKQPIDGLILSNMSRAGVLGFSKSLANELARDNITVNCVCPGYTRTERVQELADKMAQRESSTVEAVFQRWEVSVPMRRMGEPPEFAALVVFLASERASYITGTAIQVDGGYIKGLF
jgi:3-oxoacyl-[acyl-carrier protein] reductase